jgi:hypothetical protein
LAELFAKEGSLDSDSLKDLRVDFIRDFSGYVDNLLAPEKRGNKNSLSFGIDIGFKFSKLPWTVNECVRTHLTCAVSVVSEVNGCR